MRGRAHLRTRSSKSGLKVETRRLPGSGSLWHFTGYLPWGARRRGMRANSRSHPSMPPAALTLLRCPLWQGWLPALFNETVVPLTGLGAPLVSFPFVDLDHVLPSQGLMRQFVMVLVARFRMSVAEIVMAYTLVSPHAIEPPHHSHPSPKAIEPHHHSHPTPAQPVPLA